MSKRAFSDDVVLYHYLREELVSRGIGMLDAGDMIYGREPVPDSVSSDKELMAKMDEYTAMLHRQWRDNMRIYDIRLQGSKAFRGMARPAMTDVESGAGWEIAVRDICKIEMRGNKLDNVKYYYRDHEDRYSRFINEVIAAAITFLKSDNAPEWAGGSPITQYGP